ncbi:MAG: 4Fe-4S binding protein [Christensenellales bacterium]
MRMNIGGVTLPGESKKNKTGEWRFLKPVVNENCNKCGVCELFCPDSCIIIDETKPTMFIDYDYCKGCGICAVECPRKAIALEEEIS